MTEERRKELFSQEAFGIKDIQELYCVSYSQAQKFIAQWKRQAGDRLCMQGKIHILDYKKAIHRDDDIVEVYFEERKEIVDTVCPRGIPNERVKEDIDSGKTLRSLRTVCMPQ